jgi:ferredoxin
MADPARKLPDNVPGRFYVDATCIDCDRCREVAPAHFERNDQEGYSFVAQQPTRPDEEEACLQALEECPVEAIGNDG